MKKKFPYNLDSLTWDSEHNRNQENKYCYCGKGIKDDQPVIRCEKCQQFFHGDCISCMKKPLLFGDTFGTFSCSVCNNGSETFERKNMSWVTIVHLVIYNLIQNAQIDDSKKSKKDQREHYYFRWKEDVCAFIDEYWDYLVPGKQRSLTWNNTIASVLSTHSNVFLSGIEKFRQTAWWTLHEIKPPTVEKKVKPASRLKPGSRKPQKRLKGSDDDDATAQKKSKRSKKEKTKGSEADLLELSSLSELSSGDDLSASDNEGKNKKRESKTDKIKSKNVSTQQASSSLLSKTQAKAKSKSTEKETKVVEKDEPVTRPSVEKISVKKKEKEHTPVVRKTPNLPSGTIPAASSSPTLQILPKDVDKTKESIYSNLIIEETRIIPAYSYNTSEATLPEPTRAKTEYVPTLTNTNLPGSANSSLSSQDEWLFLQKLDHSSKNLSFAAKRYKRKLGVRRLKRNLGIKLFDMDQHMIQLLRTPKHALEPIPKETIIQPASNQQVVHNEDDEQQQLLEKITFTPYACSFASRLYGSIRHRNTITRDEPWLSSWNGRKLRPFIRRDFQSKPKRMLLLEQIKACNGRPPKKGQEVDRVAPEESIDYVYFQKEHLAQVNQLLCRSFWEGVDVSESLLFPEFSIVALYKCRVIGCAFMTPEAYITYFAVDSGWGNASIGQFMLYHLFQTAISKDITLHVSANNNAMILYQKFGFKPEEFIVNFYDKYLPVDSVYSKNAFFLRLRR